jgi:hypothetical protein
MVTAMAKEQVDKAGRQLGATGEIVRANIRRIRDDVLRIPVTELSRRLEGLGRPIPPLGLRRIEDGTRRVDVDDLVSIAVALEVSPITLLMPSTQTSDERVAIAGVDISAAMLWNWLRAERGIPIVSGALIEFYSRALPTWRIDELERQWAERVGDAKATVDELIPDPRVRAMLRGDGS